jgi:hypothetical protein
VEFDGFRDKALYFGRGATDNAHSREIWNVSSVGESTLLDDDQVLHTPILSRLA